MVSLENSYVLWAHDINSKDWSIKSYQRVCEIRDVKEFWQLFNSFDKMGYKFKNYFLMKGDIEPTWEHPANRNGGTCSFKTEIGEAPQIFEGLSSYMVMDKLTDDPVDINGISFSPKNSWAIIKIWNRDGKNDISTKLDKDVLAKYSELSIKYKANTPEY